VFNADETGLYWKKLPNRTYIAKDEKTASGHKASKDRVTLLLCSNASGDRMLKPLLINKSLRPRALKGKDLKQLPYITEYHYRLCSIWMQPQSKLNLIIPPIRIVSAYARNTPENNRKFPDKDFLKILNSGQNIIYLGGAG
ncbi:tigger transposable element-derived protein 1, partial [Trichonephila clavipes]